MLGDKSACNRSSIVQLTTKTLCGWWLVLGLGTLIATTGAAQGAVRCDNVTIKRDALWTLPDSLDPYGNGLPEALIDAWREEARRGTSSSGTTVPAVVEERWARDSTSTKYAIAFLVAEGGYSGLSTAREAHAFAVHYKAMSGDPAPLLLILQRPLTDDRVSMALGAARGPLAAEQARIVFRCGCDAAWLIDAWRADTSPRRPPNGTFSAVLEAELILQDAVRLSEGEYRSVLLERARAAGQPWAM